MAELLDKVLRTELSAEDSFEFTDQDGQGVLIFSPRIVDLDIVAPDRVRDNIAHDLTDSQGYMTLELDIHDSLSGDLLLSSDRYEEDPYKGYMEWTTSPTNKRAARLMMLRWIGWMEDKFGKGPFVKSD
jgi:hypothetical protein